MSALESIAAATSPQTQTPDALPTWPESKDHEYGGMHAAPAELSADMLRTFARIFHEVHDLRSRLQAIPGHETIQPAGDIIECLLQDAKAAMLSTIWTAQGEPTTQQDVFSSIGDREPTTITVDGWRFDVEGQIAPQHENRSLVRWQLVATKVD